jgi:hypothetical protein
MGPCIRYLVSSPYGDVPADKDKWDFPLECDPLKTPYSIYFQSIRDFLSRDAFKPLLNAVGKKLGREINLNGIKEIIVRTEKHGLLYHPASIELILKEGKAKFGLHVAVSDTGRDWLREELSVLQRLHTKFNLPYLPGTYLWGELNSMFFLLEDWFEGYHEFHITIDEQGKNRLKLWDFDNGYKYLSPEQGFEIYKQASGILTLYYDLKDFSQIYPWHHAAGDFVVKIENEKVDVRLTTARRYDLLMDFTQKDNINPFLALFYFLLNLSIKMRLDRLDGLGEVAWADDDCVEATVTGFLEALELKDEVKHYLDSSVEFLK